MPRPTAPERAHMFIARVGGDTAKDLAHELESLAFRIRTGQLTTGCGGGPTGSSIYEYRHDPAQTHDAYFRAVADYLQALDDETLEREV